LCGVRDDVRSDHFVDPVLGFHLAPALEDYLWRVMAELKNFYLSHVLPTHCGSQNSIDLAQQEMQNKLVPCITGGCFTFAT